jgi:acyl-CoA thioesterase
MNPDNTPLRIKELIGKRDRLVDLFGMEILECTEGASSVGMFVKDSHLNAADICHGGTIFALSDVSFALASNSHGLIALALDVSISYMKPVRAGAYLTARCREMQRGKKIANYLIEVVDSEGDLVALLKATSFIKETAHFEE